MEKEGKIWVPEAPVNQAARTEVLRAIAQIYRGKGGEMSTAGMLQSAERLYEWLTKQEQKTA